MHRIDSDFVIVPLHDLPVSPLTKPTSQLFFQCVSLIFHIFPEVVVLRRIGGDANPNIACLVPDLNDLCLVDDTDPKNLCP